MTSIFNLRYHTIAEGERIHYRPLEEVQFALETGYLELEYIHGESHYVLVIRVCGSQVICENGPIGEERQTFREYETLSQLVTLEKLDLHAFRWYPTHAPVAPKPFVRVQHEDMTQTDPTQAVYLPPNGSLHHHESHKPVRLVPGTNVPYPERIV